MAMKIKNETNFSFFINFSNKVFNWNYFRTIHLLFGWIPFSIEIFTCHVSSIMSKNNSIRVDHRNNIDNIIFSEKLAFLWILGNKSFNQPFTDKRSLSLSWMLSGHNNNSFSLILFHSNFLCNDQSLDFLLTQSFPQNNFRNKVNILFLNTLNKRTNSCVGVRKSISNWQFIIGQFPSQFETKSIIFFPPRLLPGYNSLFILDIWSSSEPSSAILFVQKRGENCGCHAIIEKGIPLSKIDHIKSIFGPWDHSLYSKIKPLHIAYRIVISLHYKIILSLGYLKL